MKSIVIFAGLMLGLIAARAQECTFYMPKTEGAEVELSSYNASDKLQSKNVQKITSVKTTAEGTTASILSTAFDAKGKKTSESTLEVRCKDGVFYFDLTSMLGNTGTTETEGMEMSITGENLELPSQLTVGATLKNARVNMSMTSGGIPIMNTTVSITNRKVEAQEKLTTPAGTFDCYKISFDIESKMGFAVKAKGVQWYAQEVGLVKAENYDTKGKLTGYQLLTAIRQ